MEHHPDNSENQSPSAESTNVKTSNNDKSRETQLAKLEADLAKLSEENPEIANVIREISL